MTVSPASADDVPVDACHGAIDNGLINATSWAPQGARMYGVVVQSYATQCVTVAIGMGSCGVREPDSVINGFWTVEIPPEFGVVTFATASKIVVCLGPAPDYVPYCDQEVYRVAFYTMTKAPVYDSNHYQPCGAAPAFGPCDGMVITLSPVGRHAIWERLLLSTGFWNLPRYALQTHEDFRVCAKIGCRGDGLMHVDYVEPGQSFHPIVSTTPHVAIAGACRRAARLAICHVLLSIATLLSTVHASSAQPPPYATFTCPMGETTYLQWGRFGVRPLSPACLASQSSLTPGTTYQYCGATFKAGYVEITNPPSRGVLTNGYTWDTHNCGYPTYADVTEVVPAVFYTWTKGPFDDDTHDGIGVLYHTDGTGADPYYSIAEGWSIVFKKDRPLKPAKCDPCDRSCPCSGNPIIVSIGSKTQQVTDYETAGANRLSFVRYYNSYPLSIDAPLTFAAALGLGWRSNFDRYLRLLPVNGQTVNVIVERQAGSQLIFGLNAGQWTTDSDVDLKLTRSGSTWTLIDASDTVETYTAITSDEAVLSSIQARNGYTQTLHYNQNNQLVSVTDSYGRALAMTYQGNRLSSVTTPDALVVSYTYSATGLSASPPDRLASVAYSTNPPTQQSYLYENAMLPLALTGIVDENGNRFATWSYDNNSGLAMSSQHAGGADLTTVTYDSSSTRTVTNALGGQETYTFTTLQGAQKLTQIQRLASPGVAAATRAFTYDSNGYLASETDWNGNQTTYVNDSRGQPTTITEAVGAAQQRVTTISYHPTFHLPVQIVTPGLTTNITYDANGNLLTRTEIDATTNTTPYSTNGQSRTWTYTWSNFLLTSIQGPRTDLTQFSYDGSGALVSVTDALGHVTQITQHLPGGWPQTIVDPNGVTATLAYNARQWLLSRSLATAAGPLTTTYAYDAAGNLTRTTQPDGSALAYTYDAAHRLTGATDLFNQQIAYTLDALGDRTAIQVSTGSTLTRTRSANFDPLGRTVKDIGGVGQTTTYVYDSNGNRITITDPLGRVTMHAFDALNRPTRITDPAGGVTTFAYDAQDRLVSVTDPNGHATNYVYDGFGNLLQVVNPDSGTTVYRYDLAGNLVQRVDAAGAGVNYAYDALNRLTAVTYPGDAAENVTYRYDEAGGGFGIDRLTTVVDPAGTRHRTYDERGNLLSDLRSGGTWTAATRYAYDGASRITAITYPSGRVANYLRDAMGRVTALTASIPGSGVSTVIDSITYLPFGSIQGLRYGNGVVETRAFDLDYRQTGLSASGGGQLQNLTYGYNAADNVVSISDGVMPANSQSFGYDALDRLTSAAGGYGSLAYTYDAVGNVLTQSGPQGTKNFSYVAGGNRLAAVSTGSELRQFDYTPTGNIAQDDQPHNPLSLGYNRANRLASVGPINDAAAFFSANRYQYTYDALGQRLLKSREWVTTKTVYQYDQGGHLMEEGAASTGGLTPQLDYLYLGDQPVAMLTSGGLFFIHGDRLGTPQIVTGPSQNVNWMAAYQPFGQMQTLGNAMTQNLRLPGQYADAETGYYDNGFRTYDSTLGRYLQSDPIGLSGGLNTYAYVGNNPVNLVDPTGLRSSLTKTMCETIKKLLEYERQHGTRDAAWQFSNTGYWPTKSPLGNEFRTHGTPTAQGMVDVDWFTDVLKVSPSADTFDTTYLAGKNLWNGLNHLGEGNANSKQAPYRDPGESNALQLLRSGKAIHFYDLYPWWFVDKECRCYSKSGG